MSNIFGSWQDNKFNKVFKDYEIVAQKDLFVKVNYFLIPIEIVDSTNNTDLNILEETVIRFAENEIISTSKIAEYLAIDEDLIDLVQHKLQRKLYLSEDNKLTTKGQKYFAYQNINKTSKTNDFSYVFPSITQHLSYINYQKNVKKYKFTDTQSFDNYSVALAKTGTAGNEKTIQGILITSKDESYRPKVRPSPEQVRESLRKNKYFKNLIVYNKNPIDVPFKGGDDYFHYKLVLLKNSDKVIISDGYHINDCVLVDYVTKYYPECLEELFKISTITSNKTEIVNSVKHDINSLMKPPQKFDEGGMKREVIAKLNNDLLSGYYSAIELSFLKLLKETPIDNEELTSLSAHEYLMNESYISRLFVDLFSKDTSEFSFMFRISKDNISRFIEDEEAEMNTLVSLMIIQAKDYKESLLHDLIEKIPNFLEQINKLRPYRNNFHHGGENYISYDEIYQFYNNTIGMLNIINPSFSKSNNPQKSNNNYAHHNQERLNNITILSEKLGVEVYHQLDEFSKDKLLNFTEFFNRKDAYNFVITCYGLLQKMLRDYSNSYVNIYDVPRNISKNEVIKILSSTQFFHDKQIPKSLTTVRVEMFEKAKKLSDSTLGGYMLYVTALAYKNPNIKQEIIPPKNCDAQLYSSLEKKAQFEYEFFANEINKKLMNILVYVDQILVHRYHGNRINISLSNMQMGNIYNDLFKIIKLIGEI